MGNQSTFNYSSILFFLIGIEFGASYSMTQINILDFIQTHLALRVLRALVGLAIALGIAYLFTLKASIESETFTAYFFFDAIPKFIIGFVIYGPYVLIANKVGLVSHGTAKRAVLLQEH